MEMAVSLVAIQSKLIQDSSRIDADEKRGTPNRGRLGQINRDVSSLIRALPDLCAKIE